jgi:hypothetical protein
MASDHTHELPRADPDPAQRLDVFTRMPFASQLAAVERGEYTLAEWRALRTPEERLELLCGLCEDHQLGALRLSCFALDEWCAFARRHPYRVVKLGDEFAFIALTTPEWCER